MAIIPIPALSISGELRNSLEQPDSATGAKVTVTEHGSAANRSDSTYFDPEKKVSGYRVRIFFDNGQDARAQSNRVMEQFKNNFPDIPIYWSYDNPYFKVTVGDCLSPEEAIIVWGRVKNLYDKAFVVREEIPLSSFVTVSANPEEVADEETESESEDI